MDGPKAGREHKTANSSWELKLIEQNNTKTQCVRVVRVRGSWSYRHVSHLGAALACLANIKRLRYDLVLNSINAALAFF